MPESTAFTEIGRKFRVTRTEGSDPPLSLECLDPAGETDLTCALTEDEARSLGSALLGYANHCLCKNHELPRVSFSEADPSGAPTDA